MNAQNFTREGFLILVRALRDLGVESISEASLEDIVAVLGEGTEAIAQAVKDFVAAEADKVLVATRA